MLTLSGRSTANAMTSRATFREVARTRSKSDGHDQWDDEFIKVKPRKTRKSNNLVSALVDLPDTASALKGTARISKGVFSSLVELTLDAMQTH